MPGVGILQYAAEPTDNKNGHILAKIALALDEPPQTIMVAGVVISLQEDGQYVQVRMVDLVKDKHKLLESPYLLELLTFLMGMNYVTNIGRWSYDRIDGDLYVDWGIAIEDNEELTTHQLHRIMSGLVSSIHVAYAPMMRILATGRTEPATDARQSTAHRGK